MSTRDAFERDLDREEELARRYGRELDHERGLREHDERIAAQDRAADKAPARYAHLAYTERPSDRERREQFDERRATTRLYPRRSDSQVTALGRKAA